MNTKERIIDLLRSTERAGMMDMINFLRTDSDFFTAPASTKHHLAYTGGLAEHSLSVYDALIKLNDIFVTEIPEYQIITTALLHDLAKTNYYIEETKWRKDDYGKWESYIAWGIDDKLPLSHGAKSLFLIGKYLNLRDPEAAAVLFHMGGFTAGVTMDYALSQSFNTAVDKYPLVVLLSTADWMSSRLIEARM